MDAPDEYYYQCSIHSGMTGIIKVEGADGEKGAPGDKGAPVSYTHLTLPTMLMV